MSTRRLARAVACAAALVLMAPTLAASDSPDVVRAWFDDPAQVAQVSHLLGHAQVDRGKGLLRTEADRVLLEALRRAGFRIEIDIEASARLREMQQAFAGDRSISGFACYRTVEETYASMEMLAANHPGLLSIEDIGWSWQTPGYPIKVVVATNSAVPGPKPKLFIVASVHAREYTPAELTTRFIEDLVRDHGNQAEATWLLDHHEIHAVLQGNPDGRKRAETGLLWRKNHNITLCGNNDSAGADLNRNFPFEWGAHNGSSGVQCDITYRGPAPGSEPETQAIVNYVREEFEDRRGPALTDPADIDTQGMFIDIHSHSRLVLWPWGFNETIAPNGDALARLGRRLAWFNDYTAQQAVGLYPTDGTTDDFAYGELGLPAYTFELGTAFFQDCASFESSIYPDNSAALRYAARSLGAPYQLPYGPDAFDLSVQPDLVLAGQPATVQATLDDSRQQTRLAANSGPVPSVQPIASGSVYLQVAPWQAGATALPMQAVDGSFNAPNETAQAVVDTTGLGTGQHLVYVQGRDSTGDDGPPNAAFVEVVAEADAVTLSGTVRQAGTWLPLAAQVRTGRFETSTDAADGTYQRLLPPGTFDIEVSAPDHETQLLASVAATGGLSLVRDFDLYRLCELIDDPVEIGVTSAFVAQSPWTLRSGSGNGGGAAWLPTAGSSYANNLDISLTSAVLDLTGVEQLTLQFDSRCNTEAGWDFGYVETRVGSGPWTTAFSCDGDNAWRSVELALPSLSGAASAQLRFRFDSDQAVTAPGWAIDNIRLRGGGPDCRASQVVPVRIDAFSATPAAIVSGATSTLAWQTANAQACHIANDLDATLIELDTGELATGTRDVTPSASIAYELVCSGDEGPVMAEAEVEVAAPPAAILAFSATPVAIMATEVSTLSWQTEHAVACGIANDAGLPSQPLGAAELAAGTLEVYPWLDTLYTLQCSGVDSAVEQSLSVSVEPRPAPIFHDGMEALATRR